MYFFSVDKLENRGLTVFGRERFKIKRVKLWTRERVVDSTENNETKYIYSPKDNKTVDVYKINAFLLKLYRFSVKCKIST